jgi:mono/diheme cytochrome c family protein
MGKSKLAIIVGIVLLAVGLIVGGSRLIRNQAQEQGALVVPDLSAEAKMGEVTFATYCVECHGKNASGTDKGPPLVHQIYRTSHHGDFSFVRAVTLGVPQHHWLFGSMPPQPEVGQREIDKIVVYLRELQKANGID